MMSNAISEHKLKIATNVILINLNTIKSILKNCNIKESRRCTPPIKLKINNEREIFLLFNTFIKSTIMNDKNVIKIK